MKRRTSSENGGNAYLENKQKWYASETLNCIVVHNFWFVFFLLCGNFTMMDTHRIEKIVRD